MQIHYERKKVPAYNVTFQLHHMNGNLCTLLQFMFNYWGTFLYSLASIGRIRFFREELLFCNQEKCYKL